MSELSNCHQAPVTIGGDAGESTHYYVCHKCHQPCDLFVAPKTNKHPKRSVVGGGPSENHIASTATPSIPQPSAKRTHAESAPVVHNSDELREEVRQLVVRAYQGGQVKEIIAEIMALIAAEIKSAMLRQRAYDERTFAADRTKLIADLHDIRRLESALTQDDRKDGDA